MRVAQLRGVQFYKGYTGWMPVENSQAREALADVAVALGYLGQDDYNDACLKYPSEVEKRLKALAVNPKPAV